MNLSGAVISGMAAVYRGETAANPPMDLIEASAAAKQRWEAAKKKLHDLAVDWAKSIDWPRGQSCARHGELRRRAR
jgi:hypothetical protein